MPLSNDTGGIYSAWFLFSSTRTELFKLVELYSEEGLEIAGHFVVTFWEEILHIHYSGLQYRELFESIDFILRRYS